MIGRNFFHFSTTTFSLLAGEKRAKNVPYLFAILYRIARVSTTLHHHRHHHPSPPFCATPLFLCFSLPSVAPRFGRGETRRRASSDRVPFFARMSLRDRMRLHVPPCLRRLINHTLFILSFVRGERAQSKRVHRAATRAHNVYPSLCHDSERDGDTEARPEAHRKRT